MRKVLRRLISPAEIAEKLAFWGDFYKYLEKGQEEKPFWITHFDHTFWPTKNSRDQRCLFEYLQQS
jgi:hypothetical protein